MRTTFKWKEITSKYEGRCGECGAPFEAGRRVLWRHGGGCIHREGECEEGWVVFEVEDYPKEGVIMLEPSFLVRYRQGDPKTDRRVIRVDVVKVTRIHEDGLSFGLHGDSGSIGEVYARVIDEADEVAVGFRARLKAKQDRELALITLNGLIKEVEEGGDRPERVEQFPDGTRIRVEFPAWRPPTQRTALLIEDGGEFVWAIRFNGSDGDQWSLSNHRTFIATRLERAKLDEDDLEEVLRILA